MYAPAAWFFEHAGTLQGKEASPLPPQPPPAGPEPCTVISRIQFMSIIKQVRDVWLCALIQSV